MAPRVWTLALLFTLCTPWVQASPTTSSNQQQDPNGQQGQAPSADDPEFNFSRGSGSPLGAVGSVRGRHSPPALAGRRRERSRSGSQGPAQARDRRPNQNPLDSDFAANPPLAFEGRQQPLAFEGHQQPLAFEGRQEARASAPAIEADLAMETAPASPRPPAMDTDSWSTPPSAQLSSDLPPPAPRNSRRHRPLSADERELTALPFPPTLWPPTRDEPEESHTTHRPWLRNQDFGDVARRLDFGASRLEVQDDESIGGSMNSDSSAADDDDDDDGEEYMYYFPPEDTTIPIHDRNTLILIRSQSGSRFVLVFRDRRHEAHKFIAFDPRFQRAYVTDSMVFKDTATALDRAREIIGPMPGNWSVEFDSLLHVVYTDTSTGVSSPYDPRFTDAPSEQSSLEEKRVYVMDEMPLNGKVCEVSVDRDDLTNGNLFALLQADPNELKHPLEVHFISEKGLDGGGPRRELFELLSKRFFDHETSPAFKLASNGASIDIPVLDQTTSVSDYETAGSVLGLALYHESLLNAPLAKFIFRFLLEQEPQLEDLEELDPATHRMMKRMLATPDIQSWNMFFAVNDPDHQERMFELVKNGESVLVTDDNKTKFVQLYLKWRLQSRVEAQLRHLRSGFQKFVPTYITKSLSPTELSLFINGETSIDLKDWRDNSRYSPNGPIENPIIEWFWNYVDTLDKDRLERLLRFCTGSRRVPLGGFANLRGSYGDFQPFTIIGVRYTPENESTLLPRSRTCFSVLEIPDYPTFDMFKEMLELAYLNDNGEFYEFEGNDGLMAAVF
ncbi:MAG: hypothetical protein SGCHY_002799 [Lobulomycetales sp.]